jgi:hypothetical protein
MFSKKISYSGKLPTLSSEGLRCAHKGQAQSRQKKVKGMFVMAQSY